VAANDIKANSDATGVAVDFTFAKEGAAIGAALADTSATARSNAKGLDGGQGDDLLSNEGYVSLQGVKAEADAVSVSVGLAGAKDGVAISAGLTDASGTAEVSAAGMDGGSEDDRLMNRGLIRLDDIRADAHATGVSVELAGVNSGIAAGVTIADTSATAKSFAKGLDGGPGDDHLLNTGEITLQKVESHADAFSFGISLNAALSGGVAGGAALSDASATAEALVTGMEGGTGDDWVVNQGSINISDIKTTTEASSVSAQFGVSNAGVAIGAALADTSATARTMVKGIDGGQGEDILLNKGEIALTQVKAEVNAVSVAVTLNAAIEGGVAAGVALTDASGTAEVLATGIDGGAGNDTIINTGAIRSLKVGGVEAIEANAHATGVSVTLGASMAGVEAGVAMADTSATAITVAKGLDGGAGNDRIYNTGVIDLQGNSKADALSLAIKVGLSVGVSGGAAMTDASMTASSTVMGIDGGAGGNKILNTGTIGAAADSRAESTSISVQISGGVGGGAALADANSTATATAIGIRGSETNQAEARHDSHKGMEVSRITDEGTVTATSSTYAKGASYAVGLMGFSYGDATTTAGATSIAIAGADGIDMVENLGKLTATVTSEADGTSVGGALAGAALSDTTNRATALAAGISTSGGDDKIRSQGEIWATAGATAKGLSITASLLGAAMGDASTLADAAARGIDAGGGHDEIENSAAMTVDSRANASAKAISVGLVGVSEANTSNTAIATATGISGGDGNDKIKNFSGISVAAGDPGLTAGIAGCTPGAGGACAKSVAVSVELVGAGSADAGSTATASATGVSGGAGSDEIQNYGEIKGKALSRGTSDGTAVTLIGASKAKAASLATATAVGIDGGDGRDIVKNYGNIDLHAFSIGDASARSLNLVGASEADTGTTAQAVATGVDGGNGGDFLANNGRFAVFSETSAYAGSVSGNFAGGAEGNSSTQATSVALGMAGGDGSDNLFNLGEVSLKAKSAAVASSKSAVIFGGAKSKGGTLSHVDATGISGGSEDDRIVNAGSIRIGPASETDDVMSRATATSSSWTLIGGAKTTATVKSTGNSMGIDGGAGNDWIANTQNATIEAFMKTFAKADGNGEAAFIGSPKAFSTSGADSVTKGIDGGEGADFIMNAGSIGAEARAHAEGDADSNVFAGHPRSDTVTNANATAAGIDGGEGENRLENKGSINVVAFTETSPSSSADSDIADNSAHSSSSSMVKAAGIQAGTANDKIVNEKGGTVTVTATAEASPYAHSDESSTAHIGGSEDSPFTVSAAGIDAGHGANKVINQGSVTVTATGAMNPTAVSRSLVDTATSNAYLSGTVDAAGIRTGSGDDRIANYGDIVATTSVDAHALASWRPNEGHHTDRAYADVGLENDPLSFYATGIEVQGGNNVINNVGTITASTADTLVKAEAHTDTDTTTNYANARVRMDAGATGISAGPGNDTIKNKSGGSIHASAVTTVEAVATADENAYASVGIDKDHAVALSGIGIDAGAGDNKVVNHGTILATSDADAQATANATVSAGDRSAYGTATAYVAATALGIRSGPGNSVISNAGVIDVSAIAYAKADAYADTPWWSAYGEHETAIAEAKAQAIGIDGSGGDKNEITNISLIKVRGNATAQNVTHGDSTGSTYSIAGVWATGIKGSGHEDVITNAGTIDVTATAVAGGVRGSSTASAIGIDSGNGNDRIVNKGTITTAINGVPGQGIAIDAGGGDDQVSFLSGSTILGHIDLGLGDDSLQIFANASVTGNATGGLGNDSLLLPGPGFFGGQLEAFETAIKNGGGTFTLGNLQQVKRLEVNEGTLAIGHSYQLAGDGTFQARVNRDGSHGQLQINGEAGLDGALHVTRGKGYYINGTKYPILTANTVNGWFSSERLPTSSPLLRFQVTGYPDRVEVEAQAKSFTTVAKNCVERKIARILDKIAPAVKEETSIVLGEFQALSEPEFQKAFSSLSPDSYEKYTKTSLQSTRRYARNLHDRMHNLRLYGTPFFDAAVQSKSFSNLFQQTMSLSDSPLSLDGLYALGKLTQAQGRNGLWLDSFGQRENQGQGNGYSGYNAFMNGTSFGYDYALSKRIVSGISAGYSWDRVGLAENLGQGGLQTVFSSVYGSYATKNAYLETVLAYTQNQYENTRDLSIGEITEKAYGEHEGNAFSSYLGVGRYFKMGSLALLEPFAALQYTYMVEEGFQESGAGGINLRIADRHVNSLVGEVGLRLSGSFEGRYGRLVPEINASWNYDFHIDDQHIDASFADIPGSTFSIPGQEAERHTARLGAGLSFLGQKGLSASLHYDGEFSRSEPGHAVFGFLRYEY